VGMRLVNNWSVTSLQSVDFGHVVSVIGLIHGDISQLLGNLTSAVFYSQNHSFTVLQYCWVRGQSVVCLVFYAVLYHFTML